MRYIVATPIIADSTHITAGIVVKFILHIVVAVVVKNISTRIFRCSHINIVVVNGSNAPQIAMDEVAADFGSAGGGGTIDADSAASVVGIGFQIVISDDVVFYDRVYVCAVLRVAISVVFNRIAFKQQHRVTGPHVHDADAARHVLCYTLNIITHDDDSVLVARPYIDLRHISIAQVVVIEMIAENFRRTCRVNCRGDSRFLVVVEITILYGRVAVHVVDDRISEIGKFAIVKYDLTGI